MILTLVELEHRVKLEQPRGKILTTQPILFEEASLRPAVERVEYEESSRILRRIVATRAGKEYGTDVFVPVGHTVGVDLAAEFDALWLRSERPAAIFETAKEIRIVDLFSGCGGMTMGAMEACRALGLKGVPVLAVDVNTQALDVYGRNFGSARRHAGPIEQLLDSEVGQPLSDTELQLREELGHVHLVVGGPPCQGNSNLNNHTRRDDPKNALYLKMARFAEVIAPEHIVIENVPGVVHDKTGVAQTTQDVLRRLGYRVDTGVVHAETIGVAQSRKRFFTVASRIVSPSIETATTSHAGAKRSVTWAIEDLANRDGTSAFDTAAVPSAENRRRIDYLFAHDLYDLPDEERPDCHRLKPHSYKAVYGRLRPELPAPTITTGFGSTGQGRFVHPTCPRTITPHEAARLQFFPDFFDFGDQKRGALQEMIGNAVPTKMAYVIALELLR